MTVQPNGVPEADAGHSQGSSSVSVSTDVLQRVLGRDDTHQIVLLDVVGGGAASNCCWSRFASCRPAGVPRPATVGMPPAATTAASGIASCCHHCCARFSNCCCARSASCSPQTLVPPAVRAALRPRRPTPAAVPGIPPHPASAVHSPPRFAADVCVLLLPPFLASFFVLLLAAAAFLPHLIIVAGAHDVHGDASGGAAGSAVVFVMETFLTRVRSTVFATTFADRSPRSHCIALTSNSLNSMRSAAPSPPKATMPCRCVNQCVRLIRLPPHLCVLFSEVLLIEYIFRLRQNLFSLSLNP